MSFGQNRIGATGHFQTLSTGRVCRLCPGPTCPNDAIPRPRPHAGALIAPPFAPDCPVCPNPCNPWPFCNPFVSHSISPGHGQSRFVVPTPPNRPNQKLKSTHLRREQARGQLRIHAKSGGGVRTGWDCVTLASLVVKRNGRGGIPVRRRIGDSRSSSDKPSG